MEDSLQNKQANPTTQWKERKSAYVMLMLTAILWGSGFVPQKIGAGQLSPFCFNGLRYVLATGMLIILSKGKLPFRGENARYVFIAGGILFSAAALQQSGMQYTSIANAGFITTIYVVLVPFVSALLFRTRIKARILAAALMALIGLYLLSTSGQTLGSISKGDVIIFLGAIFWAFHIIVVGKAAGKIDPIQFSAGQFFVCAVLNLLCWGLFQNDFDNQIVPNIGLILYSGIIVIGGGFTLQTIGQQHADESKTAIILGLESVFGSIFGFLILHETQTVVQIIGAVLIFCSVLLAVSAEE